MLMSDIIRIFGSMGYTLAALFPKVFWIIYFIVALQSSMQAFFDACRSSTIPVIVTDPKELVAANTLDGVMKVVNVNNQLGYLECFSSNFKCIGRFGGRNSWCISKFCY